MCKYMNKGIRRCVMMMMCKYMNKEMCHHNDDVGVCKYIRRCVIMMGCVSVYE